MPVFANTYGDQFDLSLAIKRANVDFPAESCFGFADKND